MLHCFLKDVIKTNKQELLMLVGMKSNTLTPALDFLKSSGNSAAHSVLPLSPYTSEQPGSYACLPNSSFGKWENYPTMM